MSKEAPRMRMFAGPNGSGKSTLKTIIRPDIVGMYINPDEIEKSISTSGNIDLNCYNISTSTAEILNFFDRSSLLKKTNYLTIESNIQINNNKIIFSNIENNSYILVML
jgi:predicted ABC-type ATPase